MIVLIELHVVPVGPFPQLRSLCPLAYLLLPTLQLVAIHGLVKAALCPSVRSIMKIHLDQYRTGAPGLGPSLLRLPFPGRSLSKNPCRKMTN